MTSKSWAPKIIAVMLTALLSAAVVSAGGDCCNMKGRSKHMDKMGKKLNLTETQKAEMQKMHEEFSKQQEELRKQHHDRVLALLNDEQKAKFSEKFEGKGKGKHHGGKYNCE